MTTQKTALVIGLVLPGPRKHGRSIERIDARVAPSQTLRVDAVA